MTPMISKRLLAGLAAVIPLSLLGASGVGVCQDDVANTIRESGGSVMKIAQDTDDLEVTFHLSDKEIGDDQLTPLEKLDNVVWLNLANTKVTNAGLEHVAKLKKLEKLHLERTSIGDDGLAHLKGLENLAYLNLYGTQVTDAGLEHLTPLKNLRRLYLWQTKVTPDGAASLQAALPELKISLGTELQEATAPEASSDASAAEVKPDDAKKDAAASPDSKPAETKPAESKPAEPKPGESKPAESNPAESKPTDKPEKKSDGDGG